MLKKRTLIGMTFSLLLLTACQSHENTESNEDSGESENENIEQVEPDQEQNHFAKESKTEGSENLDQENKE